MKNRIIILLVAVTVIFSCKEKDKTEWPTDLKGKKELVSKKKEEIKKIKEDIDKLNDEILVLNPRKEKVAAPVGIVKIAPMDFEKFTTVQGSVQADKSAFISSETGGRLTSIRAKEGDYIRRGQLIATVDLSSLKTQMAEVETRLSLARTVYQKQKRLWDQNIGTEIQYLQAKNNVEQIEKGLATMNSQLAKANVYAPMSGFVEMEMAKSGEVVGPGSPILQVVNNSKVKIVADVPESFLGVIKRGQKVDINFPALDKKITKRVTMLGRQIDPSNRTFKVEVATSNPKNVFKPNLLSELTFKSFSEKNVIALSLPTILEEVSGKKYVFVMVDKDGKKVAHKKYVETGESSEGQIIVTEGLEAGDIVITEGARNINENDPVIGVNKIEE